MKKIKEKNVQEFNEDIKKTGQYLYTDFKKYSAYIATKRQSDALIAMIQADHGKGISILDVGCGDGVFTLELFDKLSPKRIVGFDSAASAIKAANKKVTKKDKKKITFLHGNVYDANKLFPKNSFDVVVVRGLLHHLYEPQKAIKALSTLSKEIVVLEPNGYNPILKLIEKVSPYHIRHEEKSYWPPLLNKYFTSNGLQVKKQEFFSIVPYFCPTPVAKSLKFIEPFMERIPYVKQFYCGTNLIYYTTSSVGNGKIK
jgi:ubiquinone/menaquinone biosynthesis C-methylase UbiE